mmetsp:Transcript_9239/g.21164  ORF Transcript_9239/g.21164 Transcript_9239/m.21164 type:complete len:87 (-) Transcript_9239:53-313(-)
MPLSVSVSRKGSFWPIDLQDLKSVCVWSGLKKYDAAGFKGSSVVFSRVFKLEGSNLLGTNVGFNGTPRAKLYPSRCLFDKGASRMC